MLEDSNQIPGNAVDGNRSTYFKSGFIYHNQVSKFIAWMVKNISNILSLPTMSNAEFSVVSRSARRSASLVNRFPALYSQRIKKNSLHTIKFIIIVFLGSMQ